jgi:hypothetical protein
VKLARNREPSDLAREHAEELKQLAEIPSELKN